MPQMMAVRITKKTYPIAVACLAAGFAMIPRQRVLGAYLVINKPEAQNFGDEGERPYLVLGNSWTSKRVFFDNYKFIGKELKNEFVPVELR